MIDQSNQRLTNKVALVTGGASGIGRAITDRFVLEGGRVVVLDFDEAAGASLRPERCVFVHGDATSESDVRAGVAAAIDSWGRLDIAVANAGTEGKMRRIADISVDDWDHVMQVNAKGPFLLAREAIPAIREQGGGSVIIISSVYAQVGNPMTAAYCASKAASLTFGRVLAVEAVEYGIRVNVICPGNVRTPMFDRALRMQSDDAADSYEKFGKLADPTEIASVALFLATDESSYMTGASIVVDFGETVRPGPVWGSSSW